MTVEEHVGQFVKDYWKWDDDYKGTTLYLDTLILLRQVVEECCKSLDPYEEEIEGCGGSPAWRNGALHTISGCHGTIRRHFAWLLKPKED